jgi:hypothetical protein
MTQFVLYRRSRCEYGCAGGEVDAGTLDGGVVSASVGPMMD